MARLPHGLSLGKFGEPHRNAAGQLCVGVTVLVSRRFVLWQGLKLLRQMPVWRWPRGLFCIVKAAAQWPGTVHAPEMPMS
jgi:hypothetical protein